MGIINLLTNLMAKISTSQSKSGLVCAALSEIIKAVDKMIKIQIESKAAKNWQFISKSVYYFIKRFIINYFNFNLFICI